MVWRASSGRYARPGKQGQSGSCETHETKIRRSGKACVRKVDPTRQASQQGKTQGLPLTTIEVCCEGRRHGMKHNLSDADDYHCKPHDLGERECRGSQ